MAEGFQISNWRCARAISEKRARYVQLYVYYVYVKHAPVPKILDRLVSELFPALFENLGWLLDIS
jgi:hypothetical protein